jgi:hypothetical protein
VVLDAAASHWELAIGLNLNPSCQPDIAAREALTASMDLSAGSMPGFKPGFGGHKCHRQFGAIAGYAEHQITFQAQSKTYPTTVEPMTAKVRNRSKMAVIVRIPTRSGLMSPIRVAPDGRRNWERQVGIERAGIGT